MGGIAIDPGGWLSWAVVGLLAGAIASRLVRGRGLGCLLDIVVGIAGAFIGGFIVSYFIPAGTVLHFFGTLVVAIMGAWVLLFAVSLVRPPRPRR